MAERLSRINMHSLIKKSNRLKYRLGSTIGLNTIRDMEFDYLISSLDTAERRICKFLYCAQVYKKYVELAFKKHEESYRGLTTPQDNVIIVQAFATMFRTVDNIFQKFMKTFDKKFKFFGRLILKDLFIVYRIIQEGQQMIQFELTKLIHKRCDKLADYETIRALNKNVSLNLITDF